MKFLHHWKRSESINPAFTLKLKSEIADLKNSKGHYNNEGYHLMLASIDPAIADATIRLEEMIELEVSYHCTNLVSHVSYELKPGDHGETLFCLNLCNDDPTKMYHAIIYCYVFKDNTTGKIIQYVSKDDVFSYDEKPGDISKHIDYLVELYNNSSSGNLVDDIHRVVFSIMKDITDSNGV